MAKFTRKRNTKSFEKEKYEPLKVSDLNDVSILEGKSIIGCDETGVGDYLTPLVAAAAYVDKKNVEELIKLGVKDSKQLSDSKIKELFPKIKDLVVFRVNYLSQKGYNNLNKYMNAHELKMFLHLKSITQLEINDKVNEDFILLDKFASVENIEKYYDKLMKSRLETPEISKKLMMIEKAENIHVSVAIASIIARYHFLEMMKVQEEECEMKFPLGVSEKVEQAAIAFIEKFGRKALYEIAKISFKTTEKIDNLLKDK